MSTSVIRIKKENVKEHTYVIKSPGIYKLSENISFCPKKNKTSAILIDSDDVTLDLDGKILKQSKCSKLTQITGITVKEGHKNVTILGTYGVIKNFTQRGIYVEGNNKNITLGDTTLLSVRGCGYGTPINYKDEDEVIIQSAIQLGDNVFMVWNGAGTYHGILENVSVINVICYENSTGLILGEGTNYSFKNSSFSNNKEYRLLNPKLTAPNLGAFYIENSIITSGLAYISVPNLPPKPGVPKTSYGVENAVFEDCKFNSNFTDDSNINVTGNSGNYSTGFYIAGNYRGLKIKNCKFNGNKSSSSKLSNPSVLSKTMGCVVTSGDGVVIEDSEFCNNIGGEKSVGLAFNGLIPTGDPLVTDQRQALQPRSSVVRNCVASNNVANSPYKSSAYVYGMVLNFASGFNMVDCTFEENRCDLTNYKPKNPEPLTCYAFGMFIYSDRKFCNKFTNNIELSNSKFSRNRVINPDIDNCYGSSAGIRIYDDLTENVLIRNCVVNNNTPAFCEPILDSEKFQSIGIDLFNETNLEKTGPSYITLIENVIQSNGDFGITSNMDQTTIENNTVKNHNVGINLQNSFHSSVINNRVFSSDKAIVDFDLPTTNLVAGNQGFDNKNFYCQYPYPPNPIFVCDPGSVPVDSGTLDSFPPLPSVSWSNTSINIPEGVPEPTYSCCECSTGKVVPCPPTTADKTSETKLFKICTNRK